MNLKRTRNPKATHLSAFSYLAVCAATITVALGSCARLQKLEAQERQASVEPSSPQLSTNTVKATNADVEALIKIGPRVTGTPAMSQARTYLVEAFRKAGYATELQPFTYTKFVDQGSTLTVKDTPLKGRALQGTIARQVSARLVLVPGIGSAADFSKVDVKGAIAVVQRGEIPFGEKAENAETAGAIGLVIFNNQPGLFSGRLTRESSIPVLAVAGEQGLVLTNQIIRQSITAVLNVNAQQQEVTGQNVIAYLDGVTQPQVIIGGHYDSVEGSPGANDNASGTAVMLAIARNLSRTPFARQAWFIAFDGEEDGLQGSRAFVKATQSEFLQQLKAMLNFDMVGINKQLKISGSQNLVNLVRSLDANISISSGNSNSSDHAAFATANVPVLFFHRGLDPNYHKPSDLSVDPELLDETTETALTIVKQLLDAKVSL